MRKIKNLFLVLLISLIFIPNVMAEEMKGENFQADDKLNITGRYDSTVFFAGSDVTSTGVINGIGFMAGENVTVNGLVEYGFFAGAKVNVKGTIENDLFVAGQTVTLEEESIILRDGYIAADNVYVSSSIGRNLKIYADDIYLSNTIIDGNLSIEANEITFGEGVKITGTLKYNNDVSVKGLDGVEAGVILVYKNIIDNEKENNFKDKTDDFISSLIWSLIFGIIIIAIFPNLFEKTKEAVNDFKFNNYLQKTGYGLLTLIVVPIAILILFITVLGIPLAIIGIFAYLVTIYLATLLVSYILGDIIWNRLFNANNNKYLALIVGIIAVKIITIIPLLGDICDFIIICLGTGLIVKLIYKPKQKEEVKIEVVNKDKPTKKRTTKKEAKSKK